jgi:hydrogenase expression/formation protein HypC
MCLGIPMKIVEMDGKNAVAEAGGIRKQIRLDLLADAAVGEYVLIHTGYAIERIDEAEALETLELIQQVYRAGMTHDTGEAGE